MAFTEPVVADEYRLRQARDVGFVLEGPRGEGYMGEVVCAGPLDVCLAYIRTRVWRGQEEIEV